MNLNLFFKQLPSLLGLASLLSLSLPTFAANLGVGAGGGGNLSEAVQVNTGTAKVVVDEVSAFALTTLLFQAEDRIKNETIVMTGPLRAGLKKIFSSDRSIHELIRAKRIEIRMDRPCLEENGTPVDGSVHAASGYDVCLSDYSMRDKTVSSPQIEILALLAHEYSHLFGASEEEADAVQEYARGAFRASLSRDLVTKISLALHALSANNLSLAPPYTEVHYLRKFAREGAEAPEYGDLRNLRERLWKAWQYLRSPTISFYTQLWIVPESLYRKVRPEFARYLVAAEFLCTQDSSASEKERFKCGARLDSIFRNSPDARISNVYGVFGMAGASCFGIECEKTDTSEKLRLLRPQSISEARADMRAFVDYLESLEASLAEIYRLSSSIQ